VVWLVAFVRGEKPQAWSASIIRNEELRLGRWTRNRDGDDLEGKGFEAMQAAVNGGLPLPGEPAA